MRIIFNHVKGETAVPIPAVVVSNTQQITDMFIVVIKSHTHELGEIISFFKSINNYWWSDSLIRLSYPITFANLLSNLSVLFKDRQFRFLEDAPEMN